MMNESIQPNASDNGGEGLASYQFRLGSLFVFMTLSAVAIAALTGQFGVAAQMAAATLVFPLLVLAVLAVPFLILAMGLSVTLHFVLRPFVRVSPRTQPKALAQPKESRSDDE